MRLREALVVLAGPPLMGPSLGLPNFCSQASLQEERSVAGTAHWLKKHRGPHRVQIPNY